MTEHVSFIAVVNPEVNTPESVTDTLNKLTELLIGGGLLFDSVDECYAKNRAHSAIEGKEPLHFLKVTIETTDIPARED
jgi:hypothetical protein